MNSFRILAALAVALSCGALPAAELGLPQAPSAEAAGFSSARLARVTAYMQGAVAAGEYAGATWLVARDGQLVTHGAAGWSDVAAHAAMTEDTAFAIASMTKLVTTVTVLSLLEEGRFNLDDPVARWLPALAHMQVLTGGTAAEPVLVPLAQPITIRHLLTHTSGLTYGFFEPEPLQTLYRHDELNTAQSFDDFIATLATFPLKFQPGAGWTYGLSTDVLGAFVEKLTGRPLEQVMRERIFLPLGMTRTGFRPPVGAPLAKLHRRDESGKLVAIPSFIAPARGTFVEAGGGLYSTLHDYARFAQMLLNGGELDGARLLGRKAVELMRSNHVEYLNPRAKNRWVPPGFGFGVRVRRDRADEFESLGSPGQFGWEGILTTYVSIDPRERMFLLLMLQHQPYDEGGVFEKFANTVYQALEK